MRRGEVYWIRLEGTLGSEQQGMRPALVIQNDVGNRHGGTTIVAAITSSAGLARYPFAVELPAGTLPRRSFVNCAHLRTIDKTRVASGPVTRLESDLMDEVDHALRLSLALDA